MYINTSKHNIFIFNPILNPITKYFNLYLPLPLDFGLNMNEQIKAIQLSLLLHNGKMKMQIFINNIVFQFRTSLLFEFTLTY